MSEIRWCDQHNGPYPIVVGEPDQEYINSRNTAFRMNVCYACTNSKQFEEITADALEAPKSAPKRRTTPA